MKREVDMGTVHELNVLCTLIYLSSVAFFNDIPGKRAFLLQWQNPHLLKNPHLIDIKLYFDQIYDEF